jgi:hypothetical protein
MNGVGEAGDPDGAYEGGHGELRGGGLREADRGRHKGWHEEEYEVRRETSTGWSRVALSPDHATGHGITASVF